jgi:hypothetical protein
MHGRTVTAACLTATSDLKLTRLQVYNHLVVELKISDAILGF